MTEPSAREVEALAWFKRRYSTEGALRRCGADDWKDALKLAWYEGWDEHLALHASTIRGIRNNRGPEWLDQYEVPHESS